ncbi:30S ribosomal protein S8 [Patescibacteria group bacterium]|nr:30S ribosomal protein S8 [Patescibacteria group bacterium]
MSDPITDMLNQIRNAQMVEKPEILIPHSQIKESIAEILAQEGFVSSVKKSLKKEAKVLKIILKYNQGLPAIADLKRVSKPGQRMYSRYSELRPVKGGQGISILSTSKGLMTNKKARKEKLGGELICEIW